MAFSPDQLIQRIRLWAVSCKEKQLIEHAYLFGSLVNRQGEYFEPDKKSDLDIIAIFPHYAISPISRLVILDKLIQENFELEKDLLCLLKRKMAIDNITSVVPLQVFELDTEIHKGRDLKLFQRSQFLDLLDERATAHPLVGHKISHDDHSDAIQAIQCAQEYRNIYCAISANGQRKVKPDTDDDDRVPKAIARSAQMLNYYKARKKINAQDDAYTINEGADFISVLLGAYENSSSEYIHLRNLVLKRSGGRGLRQALEPRDVMLLWEILANEAEHALRERGALAEADRRVASNQLTGQPPQETGGTAPVPPPQTATLRSPSADKQRLGVKAAPPSALADGQRTVRRHSHRATALLLIGVLGGSFTAAALTWNYSCQVPLRLGMAIIPSPEGVAPFALDITEVTNEAFTGWLNKLGVRPESKQIRQDDHLILNFASEYCGIEYQGNIYVPKPGAEQKPVVGVSWEGAQRYCSFVGKRLPATQEFRIAAYGPFNNRRYPWGNQPPDCERTVYGRNIGLSCGALKNGPADVKSTKGDVTPNGVYDLAGNVTEWVADADDQGIRFLGGSWARSEKPMDFLAPPNHLIQEDGSPVGENPTGDDIGFRCAIGRPMRSLLPWTKTP